MCSEKGQNSITIGYFKNENPAVIRAAATLADDIMKVTGWKVNICILSNNNVMHENVVHKDMESCDILIATKAVQSLLSDEPVLEKWEGYVVKKQDGKLYICGADKRGTIYGIYEFSRYIGVSPWYYFADVPVKKKSRLQIPDGLYMADYPSVQYRGIFLNDEEELEEWAAVHTKDGTIGPELYEKIFELILRLKGNYIWPAMHVNYFQENPENARIANEMGIVVGTSHCDMLMRSNQNEWNPWLRKNGYKGNYNAVHSNKINDEDEEQKEEIFYDYSIPGKNREVIQKYWCESIDMNRDYEVCYTIGMRGVHDFGFSTSMIDKDSSLSDGEKKEARIRLLEEIMKDQRMMLKTQLGLSSPEETLQSFIPYKEVLDLYDNGLKVPDDVTLIWANDNFGHIRRYPNEEERKRKGGHGLYYHASYWGTPDMSYLFFNSIPLAHMVNELHKAYESGIRKMWVLNAGALKPLEMDIDAFLCYGWNVGKDTQIVNDIHAYTAHWFDRYFSGGFGKELACLYETFAQLTNARKVEHMTSSVFSQAGYGDEAGERICRLEDVFDRANAIYEKLPGDEKEAFFQMFLFKVHASYYINHAFYYADRSVLSYNRGNDNAADLYTDYSGTMMRYLRNMLRYYNKCMCEGKWDRILTPDSFPPPGICFYPVCTPSVRRRSGGLKLLMWDGSEPDDRGKVTFYQDSADRKWIELGNQGIGDISYRIENRAEWLNISETFGTIRTEKRIYLSVSDMKKYSGMKTSIDIINNNDGKKITVDVGIEKTDSIEDSYVK
ncbi:MAG: glycosyl hydrolase 115 family protein, partial [Lachnospiraceae bacterium]|nr:glycosyl hydrolase 115 family protein [Lachnospiraceae bacterium]